jgi:O-antigen/teichoic acid export membrane protein
VRARIGAGRRTVARFALVFGTGTVLGQIGQVAWLAFGSRALSRNAFGTVLAAQALYGFLQLVVDNGAAWHGARTAAAGRLDDAARGRIVRLRLMLAAASAALLTAIGAVGGHELLMAVAPFAAAIFLTALFCYWESFGRSDGGPWALYIGFRGTAPALVAASCIASSIDMPLWAAGCAEAAAIVFVMVVFRLDALHDARLGLAARSSPWRSVAAIGAPTIVGQAALAFGPVALATAGAATAAAALAVAIRLLTGLTQLTGIVTTAVFPRIAANVQDPSASGDRQRLIRLGTNLVLSSAGLGLAFLLAFPPVLRLFLPHSGASALATSILAVGAAGPVGFVLLLVAILVAGHDERELLRPYCVMTVVVIGGSLFAFAAPASAWAPWLAASVLAGQLAAVVLFARVTIRRTNEAVRAIERGTCWAVALSLISVIGASWAQARLPVAGALTVVAVFSIWSTATREIRPEAAVTSAA